MNRSAVSLSLTAVLLLLPGCRSAELHAPSAPSPRTTAVWFKNVAASAGIRFFQGHHGKLPLHIRDTLGTGCAFLDYNSDGKLDILLVGQPRCALYRNRGDGTFEEVTRAAHLDQEGSWNGCAVGDFTGDGQSDLYISGTDSAQLLKNNRGVFEDVTRTSGLRPEGIETSAAFFDANGDGRLDLYVGRYVRFDAQSVQYCTVRGVQTACGPLAYPPDFGSLYINHGNGTFADRTDASGFSAAAGKCLGIAVTQSEDGYPMVALANDEMPGNLFLGDGNGKFTDIALPSGVAFDAAGYAHGGMGADWADVDGNGRLDLFVATFTGEARSLYLSQGKHLYRDEGTQRGLGASTTPYVGFGARCADFDNDGDSDLLIANGHVQAGFPDGDTDSSYRQPLQLFENERGHFTQLPAEKAGPPFLQRYVGRGLATGDYDGDGGLDVLIVDSEGEALLLHNEISQRGNWLKLDIEQGEGAIVSCTVGTRSVVYPVTTSGSYLSANPLLLTIGLGQVTEARNVRVRWLNGKTRSLGTLAGQTTHRISCPSP